MRWPPSAEAVPGGGANQGGLRAFCWQQLGKLNPLFLKGDLGGTLWHLHTTGQVEIITIQVTVQSQIQHASPNLFSTMSLPVSWMPVNSPTRVFFFLNKFIYLFFGCIGSSLLHAGFLQLQQAGASLCCGARALGAQASVVVARRLQSAGSVVVVHGLSCSAVCGIFLDQGSNPCPLHWQVDSQPLCYQGRPQLPYSCIPLCC